MVGYNWRGARRDLELSFLPLAKEEVVEGSMVVIETVLDSLFACLHVVVHPLNGQQHLVIPQQTIIGAKHLWSNMIG